MTACASAQVLVEKNSSVRVQESFANALESCFAVPDPQAVFAPRRKLTVAGVALFVLGLALILLGALSG